jgi:hypothetical protein
MINTVNANISTLNTSTITIKDTENNTTIMNGNQMILQQNGGTALSFGANVSGNIKISANINDRGLTSAALSIPIEINGITYYIQLFNSV